MVGREDHMGKVTLEQSPREVTDYSRLAVSWEKNIPGGKEKSHRKA